MLIYEKDSKLLLQQQILQSEVVLLNLQQVM